MPKPMKTAKHKLNSAHVHGALIIAGFLGPTLATAAASDLD